MMDIAFNTQHTGFRGHDHKGYLAEGNGCGNP